MTTKVKCGKLSTEKKESPFREIAELQKKRSEKQGGARRFAFIGRKGGCRMPLPIAPEGEELTVKKVLVDEKNKRHFENLGITIGAKLQVLSRVGGNVIVKVKDGRLALDRTLAMKILV